MQSAAKRLDSKLSLALNKLRRTRELKQQALKARLNASACKQQALEAHLNAFTRLLRLEKVREKV